MNANARCQRVSQRCNLVRGKKYKGEPHGATDSRDENNEIVIRTVRGPEINEPLTVSYARSCPIHFLFFIKKKRERP